MTECPGSCNRDWRRAEALAQPHDIDPVLGAPIWCEPCVTHIRHALDDFVEIYCLLEDAKGHASAPVPDDMVRSTSAAVRSPSPQADEQDESVRLLVSWDATVKELRFDRVADWRAMREPIVLTGVVKSLRGNLDWALAHADIGTDLGVELLKMRGRLREQTASGSGAIRKAHPCPRCDQRTLAQEPASDYVACGNCGRLLTLAEYDDLAAGRHADASA